MKFKKLLKHFDIQLNEIKNEKYTITKEAKLAITTCSNILSELNQIIYNSSFKNMEEEINFHKKIKVVPLSNLIFYCEVLSFENVYPKVNRKEQEKYVKRKIKKVNKFYAYNVDFIQYIKEDRFYLDELYFTKSGINSINFTNTNIYYLSADFSTSHDILLGKLKGFDLLMIYLQKKLNNLQNIKPQLAEKSYLKSNMHWTSSKANLTELIYALHSSRAINNGTTGIKEIATAFEKMFNINLGNYYHRSIEIRSRKINKTIFMDNLKESLMNSMDKFDK